MGVWGENFQTRVGSRRQRAFRAEQNCSRAQKCGLLAGKEEEVFSVACSLYISFDAGTARGGRVVAYVAGLCVPR